MVPKRWRGDVAEIVVGRADWIQAALEKVADRRALFLAEPDDLLPDIVRLDCVGAHVPVEYELGRSRFRALESPRRLVVAGEDADCQLRALRRWLQGEATRVLLDRSAELSRRTGIEPASVRVRKVRSRWGSCSARGGVSLNRDLVFLPSHLVDAVIYHELAHLSHLNHSPSYYAALERLDPQWELHRAQLRGATSLVPVWADA